MDTSSIEEVRALYEETADSYSKMMDTEINLPIYSDILSRLSKRISNFPGPVVDTSCGSGHMLYRYHTRYDPHRSLVGIDLSGRMVENTSNKLGKNAKTIIADMRDLSMISTGSSAAVLSFFALHHLNPDNALKAFKEWHRILCVQGQLVVAVWEGSGPIDYGDETDIVAIRYTKDEVISWATDSGFVIDRCTVESVEEMSMKALYLEATKH